MKSRGLSVFWNLYFRRRREFFHAVSDGRLIMPNSLAKRGRRFEISRGLHTVPHRPDMRVADVVRGVSEHIRHARRAAGDIRYVGIFLHDFSGRNRKTVPPRRYSARKHPVDGHRLNLVIAAEQRKRWVEMQTFHLIFRFLFTFSINAGRKRGYP